MNNGQGQTGPQKKALGAAPMIGIAAAVAILGFKALRPARWWFSPLLPDAALETANPAAREKSAPPTPALRPTAGMFFSMAIGASLVAAMTQIRSRPYQRLAEAANRIAAGDLTARAPIGGSGRIGHLTASFNRMAGRLEQYCHEVEQKERIRLLLLRRIVNLQEEERRKLSQELHDHLGQSLLELLLRVERACSAPGDLGCDYQKIQEKVRTLIDDVHNLACGMRPSLLDHYGLDPALRAYSERTSRLSGIKVDYQYMDANGLGRLPSDIELTLYRVAQEAVTNLIRHSGASHSSVVLVHREDEVVLLIEDDGCGFDISRIFSQPNALGLVGMRERVVACGGICKIDSAPQRGTMIKVKIPLNGGRSEHTDTAG